MGIKKKKDNQKAARFWASVEQASFEVEETEALELPYTRYQAYRRGFENGWRQRDAEAE